MRRAQRPHLATILAGALTAVLLAAPAPAAEVVPDGELQAGIAAVARARDEQQLAVALENLRGASEPGFSDLVPQLALFLLEAKGERAGMTPALIVSRLGISQQQILRGVEPHLDTDDPALRAQLENLLGALELDELGALLAQRDAPATDGLVRYLYQRSPARAVEVLAQGEAGRGAGAAPSTGTLAVVEQARAALAAGTASDQERARAADALEALARDPDWRLRAYAAAVAAEEPRLAADGGALVGRLASDPERRVRAVARTGVTSGTR
ncbi:MAG: hypothetical protein AB1689_06105 [Thermodesulfobacteriota bacterium]